MSDGEQSLAPMMNKRLYLSTSASDARPAIVYTKDNIQYTLQTVSDNSEVHEILWIDQ